MVSSSMVSDTNTLRAVYSQLEKAVEYFTHSFTPAFIEMTGRGKFDIFQESGKAHTMGAMSGEVAITLTW